MPSSQSPLARVAAQFGYHLDNPPVPTDAPVDATATRAAQLCATLICYVSDITDTGLRHTLGQEPAHLDDVVADTVTAIDHAYRAIARFLAHAVTTGAARQLTPGGSRTADPLWRPGVVRVADADGGPYPCQIGPRHWNGWARPRFTRDIVTRLMADLDEQWRHDARRPAPPSGHLLDNGDVRLLHDEGVEEVITPDGDDMLAVGAGTWTWQEWPD